MMATPREFEDKDKDKDKDKDEDKDKEAGCDAAIGRPNPRTVYPSGRRQERGSHARAGMPSPIEYQTGGTRRDLVGGFAVACEKAGMWTVKKAHARMDVASRQEHQLTFSRSDKYDPVWSPDGQSIIYSSNDGGYAQIWRIPVAGGKEQRLTTGYDRIRHVSFSPDGRWIYLQPNHLNIYRMPASGGPFQQVTKFPESGLFIEDPKLSPDGRWLAYCRNNGGSSLWLLELGTSLQTAR